MRIMAKRKFDGITIFLFLLPALILFVGILVAPLLASGYYSFFEWKGFGDSKFIGLDNYKTLFKTFTYKNNEVPFLWSARNALILALCSVFIQLPLSLGLALLLGKGIKSERFFLSINFLPVLISTVVIGELWRKIYYPDGGLLNSLLRKFGVLKKGAQDITWLAEKRMDGSNSTLLQCVIVPMLWQYVGYHMLLMYAGVKSVPPELREAAKIDGATDWQVDRYIVIPSMKQIIKVSVIFAVTGSLKSYDIVSVLATDKTRIAAFPSTLLKDQMGAWGRYGMGSAIAVCLIVLCFFFAVVIGEIFKDREKV